MAAIHNIWDGKMVLGEGPVWDPSREVLWFVDIKRSQIHRFDPRTSVVDQWASPAQVGWVLPAAGDKLIAGLQTGLALFDPSSGKFTPLSDVENDRPGNRLNDATVANDGSVWFGSMDDDEAEASGRYYRWDGREVHLLAIKPAVVTNGPALSPDQRTLYHVDTTGGFVYRSQVDANCQIAATEVFARIDPADGFPDGCCTDAHGNVWLGLWGGWRARLYSPAGDLLHEVELPTANVTKVALGGRDMKTAYVTTARAGLDDAALARQSEAGSLFAFKVDVPGCPPPLVRVA